MAVCAWKWGAFLCRASLPLLLPGREAEGPRTPALGPPRPSPQSSLSNNEENASTDPADFVCQGGWEPTHVPAVPQSLGHQRDPRSDPLRKKTDGRLTALLELIYREKGPCKSLKVLFPIRHQQPTNSKRGRHFAFPVEKVRG